jgi:hypothetical protein
MRLCIKWHQVNERNTTWAQAAKAALDNATQREKKLCSDGGYSGAVMDVYEDVLKSVYWHPEIFK